MNSATVSKVIHRCKPSVYRVWIRCMLGIYPVQTYLKRIGLAQSPDCLSFADGTPETLAHFACVCSKFLEALRPTTRFVTLLWEGWRDDGVGVLVATL